MSWFQQNKFTAVFGGITLVASGVLGWLVLGAKSDLETAQSAFSEKLSRLTSLQNGKPFPNVKSVAAYKAELSRVEGEVSKLRQKLVTTQYPLEDVRPNAFQDLLKKTIDRIKQDSIAKKMLLPGQKKDDAASVAADPTFNLGFSNGTKNYLETLPQDEASSELARELKVIDFVVQQLLANGVSQLLEVKRSPLPSEKGDKADDKKKDDKKADGLGDGKPKKDDSVKAVKAHKFEIKFVSTQAAFIKVLNGITSAQQPFIIPRRVSVKNEAMEGPLKDNPAFNVPPPEPPVTPDPNAPADPAAPAAPAVPATPAVPADGVAPAAAPADGAAAFAPGKGGAKFNWIVGEEKLEVELELEMVDFADATPAVEQKGKTSK